MGGDDIEITLLGYEVSALTESRIQSHFISGDQTGAYVLVPQVPAYWRDAGDDQEHLGDMPSRYQGILMDLLNDQVGYVQDPEVIMESDEDTFYYGLIPDADGGTMRVPDGNGGVYEDIYDWMNDQSLEK